MSDLTDTIVANMIEDIRVKHPDVADALIQQDLMEENLVPVQIAVKRYDPLLRPGSVVLGIVGEDETTVAAYCSDENKFMLIPIELVIVLA